MRRQFVPGSIDYDAIAANYAAGRGLSPEAAAVWRKAIEPFIPRVQSATILDLGAGTGRFSPLLATFPGVRVIGVEPSRPMIGVAVRHHRAETIGYVAGFAESIPLRDCSCDVAWVSHAF